MWYALANKARCREHAALPRCRARRNWLGQRWACMGAHRRSAGPCAASGRCVRSTWLSRGPDRSQRTAMVDREGCDIRRDDVGEAAGAPAHQRNQLLQATPGLEGLHGCTHMRRVSILSPGSLLATSTAHTRRWVTQTAYDAWQGCLCCLPAGSASPSAPFRCWTECCSAMHAWCPALQVLISPLHQYCDCG